MAVLDVSAIDPERSEGAHALTGAHTVKSARAIEERFFECISVGNGSSRLRRPMTAF
jgi:hypothetical protein